MINKELNLKCVLILAMVLAAFFSFGNNPKKAQASTTINAASCSQADVQNALNQTQAGDTVKIPAGTCEWTVGLSITNGANLKGAGGGGYVGRSRTAMIPATGSKIFTTQAGLNFINGETIVARYPNLGGVDYMSGTVSSYSGTTLALNVTASNGTASHSLWVFERPALTTLIDSAVSDSSQSMVTVTESTTNSIQISDIKFDTGTGSLGSHIKVNNGGASGKPVLIHNNWFMETGLMDRGIAHNVNRGVVYSNSFSGTQCAATFLGCATHSNGALGMINATNSLYAAPSTLGTNDTDGTHKIYYEDNYFLAIWQALSGFDDGARVAFRHNILDQSAIGSHGAETSPLGVREWEITDNISYYDNLNPAACEAYNINYFFYIRGGTGVITDNAIDDINSGGGCYGDKPEIVMTQQNLRRTLNSALSCWGANTAGVQYPAPRQVGLGYVTGTAGNSPDGFYFGDSEPIYIWNNTGSSVISLQDYSPNDCGAGADSVVDYIKLNRDYFLSAKPGYTKFAYPHPLRAGTVTPPATLQGDLNNDGIVNSLDWSIMNSKWFTSDATADLNHDGVVNSLDWSIMNSNWFKTW